MKTKLRSNIELSVNINKIRLPFVYVKIGVNRLLTKLRFPDVSRYPTGKVQVCVSGRLRPLGITPT